MAKITRMTFFKLSKAEDQDACLAAYPKMFSEAKKVSHPHTYTIPRVTFY